jgi:hypothetical protein
MDTDGKLKIGGCNLGANKYSIWNEYNTNSGSSTFSGTLTASATTTLNINIGSGYTRGYAIVESGGNGIRIDFTTVNTETLCVGISQSSTDERGSAWTRNISGWVAQGTKTVGSGYCNGIEAFGNYQIQCNEFYINGSNIQINLENKDDASSRNYSFAVHWEVI